MRLRNETFMVIGWTLGAWGKGGTVGEATAVFRAALGHDPKPKDKVDVIRVSWRSDNARTLARSFDRHRASGGLPSWVNEDGSPYITGTEGILNRPSGTDVEDVVKDGRWHNGGVVAR